MAFVFKLILFCLLLNGTFLSHAKNSKTFSFYGFNSDQPSAKKGLESIFKGEEYFTGIPQRLFKLGLIGKSSTSRFKDGVLPSPPNRHTHNFRNIPLGLSSFEQDGIRLINTNCFSCHAGVVAGQVIAGAPNAHFDVLAQKRMVDKLKKFHKPIDQVWNTKKEEKALADFIAYYDGIIVPGSKSVRTRGDNPGPWIVWYTIAKFQQTPQTLAIQSIDRKTSDELEILNQFEGLPTVSPPAWWNLKYKKRAFWANDVTHWSPSTFSLNLLDQDPRNIGTIVTRMDRTQTHLDFARSTKAPKYPFKIDKKLAAYGYRIFHSEPAKCFKCHGRYEKDGSLLPKNFPNKAQIDVGTDNEYARILNALKPLYEKTDFLFSQFRGTPYFPAGESTLARHPKPKGYAPQPLKGIWATAPYFHNGSVPTLAQVLDSQSRVGRWNLPLDPFSYNQREVGIFYTVIGDTNEISELTYDTTDFGKSNSGHRFGDRLNSTERKALLEFLKTL